MRLVEVEGLNFCQHRHIRHRFAPGLTAVIGANGSGKSNFMGLIRFVLTGINPNVGDKADNICQLADPTERSFGRLQLEHGTTAMQITRHLRPETAKTELIISSEPKPIRGDKAVNAKLAEILGSSFDIVDEMVLVPQEEIFGFLDLLPAKRAASFQRLFRTEAAKDIYDALQKFLLVSPISAVTISVNECRCQLAGAQNSVEQWERHVQSLRESPTIQADRDLEIKKIGTYEARTNTASAIVGEQQQLADLQRQFAIAEAQRLKYVGERAAIAADLDGNVAATDAARAALTNLENYRRIEQARELIRENRKRDQSLLDSLQSPPVPPGYMPRAERDAALHDAQAKLSECRVGLTRDEMESVTAVGTLETALSQLVVPTAPPDYLQQYERARAVDAATRSVQAVEDFLRVFADSGVAACPTCGTPTTNLQARMQSELASLPGLEAALGAVAQAVYRSEIYDDMTTKYARDKQTHENNLVYWRDQLARAKQAIPLAFEFERIKRIVDSSAFYEAALTGYNTSVSRFRQALANYDQQEASLQQVSNVSQGVAESDLRALINSQQGRARFIADYDRLIQQESQSTAQLTGRITQLAAAIKTRQESLAALADVSPEEYQAAGQRCNEFAAELQARQSADATLTVARQGVVYWTGGVVAAEQAEQEVRVIREARAKLEAVRDLFHHSNLPRFVAHRNLERLQLAINQFLELFQADFRVQADEGLSFMASFLDHRRQPAERLSGGQKVVLALAFRLAVNVMFAENIGLLALDEPTAFLDEHHIRGFEPVLQRLREFSTARGLQCVMITHERSLAPLFDAVISL